jgi:hypothetical protein
MQGSPRTASSPSGRARPQIKALVADGPLQLSIFDERDLAEITAPDYPGEQLIVCRNAEQSVGSRARVPLARESVDHEALLVCRGYFLRLGIEIEDTLIEVLDRLNQWQFPVESCSFLKLPRRINLMLVDDALGIAELQHQCLFVLVHDEE